MGGEQDGVQLQFMILGSRPILPTGPPADLRGRDQPEAGRTAGRLAECLATRALGWSPTDDADAIEVPVVLRSAALGK